MPLSPRRRLPAAFPRRLAVAMAAGLLLLPVAAGPAWSQTPSAPKADADGVGAEEAIVMLRRAADLWAAGEKDDAVFWFYAGQLRFRTYLAANPGLDPSGAPALFSAMMETLGAPINGYAFGDIPALVATMDRVLAWDAASPGAGLPEAARQKTRDRMAAFRDSIRAEADSIRAQRAANSLENR